MATLQSQKKALRKSMSIALRSLSASDVDQQSQAIARRVLALPLFQQTTSVSCYISMPSGEVDTSALISEILRAGKTLYVPRIGVSGTASMDFLRVFGGEDLHAFPPGEWGIREPTTEWAGRRRPGALDEDAGQLDMILCPGVAFDRSLSRLGHGKGYYDRFLSAYSAQPTRGRQRPLLVALALREQILEAGQVPATLHDWKMDVIVCPDETIGQ